MLLGALRHLGRGWTFDDASKSAGVSEDALMNFFEIFVIFGSMEFYDRHVKNPDNEDDYNNNNAEHTAAGFTGSCSSTADVNIAC